LEVYFILINHGEDITLDINTKIIGKKIFHFKTIDSTNQYARILLKENIDDGSVVIADTQTGGRGRKNRKWSSPIGGLWFSVILYPHVSSKKGMTVTMAASISVADAINKLYGLNTEIKWPNDILINGKKVCGILTEIETKNDEISNSIVGIGINVNNYLDSELINFATSLKIEIGHGLSTVNFFRDILKNFDMYYEKIKSGDYLFIKNQWCYYANIIGRKIEVLDDDKNIKGLVIDIDDDGSLILKKGKEKIRIVCGDIKYF
jgi:BirA family biotin operon repressor/biotin-[acetyl-CoA-carboxylase] ligase